MENEWKRSEQLPAQPSGPFTKLNIPMATMTSDTGRNDPNSIWGSVLGTALQTGSSVFGSLKQTEAEKAKASAERASANAQAATAASNSRLYVFGGIGLVVLALVAFVFLRKK
jgi:hypothetical protein